MILLIILGCKDTKKSEMGYCFLFYFMKKAKKVRYNKINDRLLLYLQFNLGGLNRFPPSHLTLSWALTFAIF